MSKKRKPWLGEEKPHLLIRYKERGSNFKKVKTETRERIERKKKARVGKKNPRANKFGTLSY